MYIHSTFYLMFLAKSFVENKEFYSKLKLQLFIGKGGDSELYHSIRSSSDLQIIFFITE